MSISYEITSTGDIDGATVIDVTTFTTDARGVRQVDAGALDIGRVQLNTIPGVLISDAWVQVAFITEDDPAATPTYSLRMPAGATIHQQAIPINAAAFGWYDSPWNILVPQNGELVFALAGGVPNSGTIFFSLWSIDHEVWPELNAPHVFSNLPTPTV